LSNELEIIALNVPYPPNYGGAIDIYYRIKALENQGIKINLHSFVYDRPEHKKLENFNTKYYPRKSHIRSFSLHTPIIINSRQSKILLNNLLKSTNPILFEGLHTCLYLDHPKLDSHKKIVRLHNVEWQYYKETGKKETSWLKKLFYAYESKLLEKYEKQLKYANFLCCISKNDTNYYKKAFPTTTNYLPVFHQHEIVDINLGKGDFILYHGNLQINENVEAVEYLLKNIHHKTKKYKWVIAGKNPSKSMINKCKDLGIKIISNPEHDEMNDLIRNAHINILPTFQDTGIKLKLLNALFIGRFCLANSPMVANTGLEDCCIIANEANEFIEQIYRLMEMEFTSTQIEPRKSILETDFNNALNAQRLVGMLECENA